MAKYLVSIKEVHYSIREVEADSPEQAKELAGDADEMELVYSHTCDESEWTVTEVGKSRV